MKRTGAITNAYEGHAAAWAAGPELVYRQLAEVLVADCPVPLGGSRVLDLGAGTGVASRVAVAAGGRVVALDLAEDMLLHDRMDRPPAVRGDALALPFADATFDAVLAACLVVHLPDPAAALAEAARVTRRGGAVVATSFAAGTDPVKAVVDGVAAAHGWQPPEWYRALKACSEPQIGDAERFAAAGRRAGLRDVAARELRVPVTVDAAGAVGYRLGMAHLAGWVAELSPARRAAVQAEASGSVSPVVTGWQVELLVLTGRA